MLSKKASIGKHILKYGVIFCGLWLLRFLITYIIKKLEFEVPMPIILITEALLFFFCTILAIYTYKKKNSGYLKFLDGLKIGTGAGVIISIFLLIRLGIYGINNPNLIDDITNDQREEMITNNPLFSPGDITETTNFIFNINDTYGFMFHITLSFTIALIGTTILYKRKKHNQS